MRISDWSLDVCSSDLTHVCTVRVGIRGNIAAFAIYKHKLTGLVAGSASIESDLQLVVRAEAFFPGKTEQVCRQSFAALVPGFADPGFGLGDLTPDPAIQRVRRVARITRIVSLEAGICRARPLATKFQCGMKRSQRLRASATVDGKALLFLESPDGLFNPGVERSEERRVGKECVSKGRSRLWADHKKKK